MTGRKGPASASLWLGDSFFPGVWNECPHLRIRCFLDGVLRTESKKNKTERVFDPFWHRVGLNSFLENICFSRHRFRNSGGLSFIGTYIAMVFG